MTQLIEFYKGTGTDDQGRTLAEIWSFSDRQMEAVHDFIQWLFPLPEPSAFNPDAPLLTDENIAAFASDPQLRDNLRRSLGRFLAFLGLSLEGSTIAKAEDFAAKAYLWRVPNHNWLRITRALRCTRLLGLGPESRSWFEFLDRLRNDEEVTISDDTFAYWQEAAKPR